MRKRYFSSVNGRADAEPDPVGMVGWVSSIMTESSTSVGGGSASNVANCGSSGGSNCYITTHLNASGQPTCSSLRVYSGTDDVVEVGGICPPTVTSCAAVGGTWTNGSCYCAGSWNGSPNSQQSYTGYKCS